MSIKAKVSIFETVEHRFEVIASCEKDAIRQAYDLLANGKSSVKVYQKQALVKESRYHGGTKTDDNPCAILFDRVQRNPKFACGFIEALARMGDLNLRLVFLEREHLKASKKSMQLYADFLNKIFLRAFADEHYTASQIVMFLNNVDENDLWGGDEYDIGRAVAEAMMAVGVWNYDDLDEALLDEIIDGPCSTLANFALNNTNSWEIVDGFINELKGLGPNKDCFENL